MRVKKRVAAAALFIAIAATVPIVAHHSFAAEFAADKPVQLTGTLTKLEWINPHVWIYLDVKGPAGAVTNWGIEGGAPNAMSRRRVSRDTLPIGVQLRVEGYRAKSGKPVAKGLNITWPDGRKAYIATPGTGAPDDPQNDK